MGTQPAELLQVGNEREAVQEINSLGELDRGKLREHFEQRFSAKRMAAEYVTHYERWVSAKAKFLKQAVPGSQCTHVAQPKGSQRG